MGGSMVGKARKKSKRGKKYSKMQALKRDVG